MSETISSPKQALAADVHVGSRVRTRRKQLGVSQEKLSESLGITFQQVQKYEKGTNRIGASRLQRIAEILNVPVSYFFEDLGPSRGTAQESGADHVFDFLSTADGLELNRTFARIRDAKVRRKAVALVKALAEAQEADGTVGP